MTSLANSHSLKPFGAVFAQDKGQTSLVADLEATCDSSLDSYLLHDRYSSKLGSEAPLRSRYEWMEEVLARVGDS